jgi:hypothetical protein
MSLSYEFYSRFARILNSGQSRSVILCGNIYDLFWDGTDFVPLIPFLCRRTRAEGIIQVVYELNGPIQIAEPDRSRLADAWAVWKGGADLETLALRGLHRRKPEADFHRAELERHLRDAIGNATLALELLRQLSICSRHALQGSLLIVIEAADMLLPMGSGDLQGLHDAHLRRISIVKDWFGDPAFLQGTDSVCLIAESRGLVHSRISKMPQVLSVEVPSPDAARRRFFIDDFCARTEAKPELWSDSQALADFCAGLSNHAIRQLLLGAAYVQEPLTPQHVVDKVEDFIQAQLGEDVIEFKKPEHRLDDLVGFGKLREFLRRELIPRFRARGDASLAGAAVAGPIGGGKTFIFEAVAAELDMPVLVLKNIRSQWFGQTDVIFERLRHVLTALEKVVIFVDEADTQFGAVGAAAHDTERRLTGKIQAMMSDPRLRGRVVWLLMTARIHLLSPDIRRPGRVGDLIVPVLDPEGDDRREFVEWVLKAAPLEETEWQELAGRLDRELLPPGYSAAAFAALRSQVKAAQPRTGEALLELVRDVLPPAISLTRRYQTLQALVNCTRRSLLPDPDVTEQDRARWELEIRELERQGIS